MLMVEYFCSVLSGATMGPNVRSWKLFDKPADLVICYCYKAPVGSQMEMQSRLDLRMSSITFVSFNLNLVMGDFDSPCW